MPGGREVPPGGAPGDNVGVETCVIWMCVVYNALDSTLKMALLEYSLSCGLE